MSPARPLPSNDPRRFGRRPAIAVALPAPAEPASLIDDLKLFATTFAGGFLFVAIYLI